MLDVMSLSYPFQTLLLGCVTAPTPRYFGRTRWCHVQATPPSSVILNADESGKFSEKIHATNLASGRGAPFVTQGSTVGIIGGVSVDATLKFLRKLVELSSEDGGNSIPFLLCSDPFFSKELLSFERSYFVSSTSRAENLKLDSSSIVQSLRNKRVFLENSGASCIVMPCNVSHSWYEQVCEGCSVPVLHMADSPLPIGVLATNATLAAGFYKEKLQNEGFEVVLPDRATMEHTVIPAIEALNRKDMEGACNLLRIALQVLLVRAANSVILASDDMRDLLPPDDPLLKKCVDPMDALVRSTLKWIKSSGRNT
uniref:Aspartate racemase n=1 Tax=Phaseolus vulgaris TaxID=3885 RepID=V7C034_PHAVU|nr:hypothetical protein PHAVU_005G175300g [Phaseolus vulgaris]ESW22713.1 hypothetical protein PHAVU_005G175300g [Phaseolus vulgaris]